MVHLTRLVLAAVLGAVFSLLGGCVLTGLEAGFNLSPPGPYVLIRVGNPPEITTQPATLWTLAAPGQTGGVSGQGGTAVIPGTLQVAPSP